MAEKDTIGSIEKITQVVSSLRAMTEPKGTSSSVTRDDDRVSDKLSPTEQNRLKESATIIGRILKVGAFKEGPEAKRIGDLTPTAAPPPAQIKAIPTAVRDKVTPPKTETSWWDTLKKVAGAAGLAGLLWYLLPKDWKDKINKWWNDALSAFLGDENKKALDKWWNDAISPLLGDEKTKGKISRWWDDLWNSVFDKDGKTKDKFLSIWDNIFNLDEGTELSFSQKLAAILGTVIQGAIDITSKTFNLSGAAGDVRMTQKLLQAPGKVAENIKKKIPGMGSDDKVKPPSRGEAAAKNAKRIKEFSDGKITTGVRKDGTRWFRQNNKFISQSEVPKSFLKNMDEPGVISKVGRGIKGVYEKISKAKNAFTGFISKANGVRKVLTKIAKFPLLAPIFEAGSIYFDNKELEELYSAKKITADEYNKRVGKRVVEGVGGLVGSIVGSSLLGTLGSVVPVVGNVAGVIIGAGLGDYVGRLLVDQLLSDKYAKSIGSYFTNVKESAEEMQDFLVKGGNVYRFNTKDEVLGMKTGGAIDNLMTGLTQGLAKDNSVIRDASIAQVNKLDELIHLMTELLKKPTQSSNNITTTDNSYNRSYFKPFALREQFTNQTLIPTIPQPV